jgi:hypothetical protein
MTYARISHACPDIYGAGQPSYIFPETYRSRQIQYLVTRSLRTKGMRHPATQMTIVKCIRGPLYTEPSPRTGGRKMEIDPSPIGIGGRTTYRTLSPQRTSVQTGTK